MIGGFALRSSTNWFEFFEQIHRPQHLAFFVVELHQADLDHPHRPNRLGAIGAGDDFSAIDADRFAKVERTDVLAKGTENIGNVRAVPWSSCAIVR